MAASPLTSERKRLSDVLLTTWAAFYLKAYRSHCEVAPGRWCSSQFRSSGFSEVWGRHCLSSSRLGHNSGAPRSLRIKQGPIPYTPSRPSPNAAIHKKGLACEALPFNYNRTTAEVLCALEKPSFYLLTHISS